MFHWPYYVLYSGKLYVERSGRRGLVAAFHVTPVPLFASVAIAEQWLKENDFRGNVREAAR